jgi:2',3'-cyclic-nucleotide 2'-phosphodiesterase (5'-nucleotidase family)
MDRPGVFSHCRSVRLARRLTLPAVLSCAIVAVAGCRRAPLQEGAPAAAPVAAAATPVPGSPPPRGKQITLLYASNGDGDYEQCGCPVHPLGGIGRRATVIDRARAEADAALVLDAGDLFLPQRGNFVGGKLPDAGEIERRARLLSAAYGRIGTTAFLPAERDLALGLPLLRRLAKQAGLPLIAANLYGRDGNRLFDADRIVDAAGLKIGVFGVTAPPASDDVAAFKAAGIEARDPVTAARDEVADLRARGARIVVALVHVGDVKANRNLLAAVPGIDWAVLGHSGMNLEMPEKVGTARMLEAMMKGKHVGRLDLHVVGDQLAFTDRGERAEIETILADHRRQLTEYDKRLGDTDPATMRNYYEQRRKEIGQAIERESALLQRMPAAITGSWFENRIIPLDATTPDQPGVAILVDAYNKESVKRAAAGKPVGLGTEPVRPNPAAANPTTGPTSSSPATSTAAMPAGPGYIGSAACGACHAPALAQWKTTKHARALSALARIGRDKDPSCVGCHVTGYLQPGGPADVAAARKSFANVGCESCHGGGKAHLEAADKKKSTARAVPEAICRGCHTADVTNGEFDYRKFVQAIVGPGHGAAAPL